MAKQKQNSATFLKILGFTALLFLLSVPAYSQNTKGDRPIKNQRKVRETNGKSIKKKERGKTKDISGRRLRTRNKSSASRANASYPQTSPYEGRKRSTKDRAAKPRGRTFANSPRESRTRAWTGDISGHPIRRIRPSKSGVARNNVYPQFDGSPLSKPRKPNSYRVSRKTSTGKPIINRSPQQKQRAWKGNIRGGRIRTRSRSGLTENAYSQDNPYSSSVTKSVKNKKDKPYSGGGAAIRSRSGIGSSDRGGYPGSASGSFIKRGKRNVYWGKFSKGERAVTKDLSGNPLRSRNFRSMPGGLVGRDTLKMFGRKPGGDRAYKGRARNFSMTPSIIQRGWRGDLTGRRLRGTKGRKSSEVAGVPTLPRNLSNTKRRGERSGRYLQGGGYSTSTNRKRDNRPVPVKAPGIGASGISRSLGKTKGRRPLLGGGSSSARGWNNNGQPVSVNRAGAGSIRGSRFQGTFKGSRSLKGGGSVSGKLWNNRQKAVGVRMPGAGSMRAGKYSGNVPGGFKNYYDQGEGYTGNIKAGRHFKGGGSVSGKLWNNRQKAVGVRMPGAGTMRAGKYTGNIPGGFKNYYDQGEGYSGNIKAQRPFKGGGSVSGKLWNNRQSPVGVRTPTSGAAKAGSFSGNIKGGRPMKGGGSVSGKLWNNRQSAIGVRMPGEGSIRAGKYSGNMPQGYRNFGIRDQGEEYSGNIKTRRPLKGGGSISNRLWNNREAPIGVRIPTAAAARAGKFSGNIKSLKPDKGGGSVSGKLWNNREAPIGVRTPSTAAAKAGYFSGHIKARRPDKGGGSVSGKLWNNEERPIDVRIPAGKDAAAVGYSGRKKLRNGYTQSPYAKEESLKKRTPHETTFDVDGLQVKVKRGKYETKPKAAEEAMLGIGPQKGTRDASKYGGNMKVVRNYKHNPSSSEDALKAIARTKSSVKAGEYSGTMKVYWKYKHAPLSADEAMKVRAPGKAYARIGDFQGNIKMRKYNDGRLHPDAQFAHSFRNNVKNERTILMDVKLFWAKLFKKDDTQPENVKENVRKPRYDKGEKGLWADDPSYEKKKEKK